MQVRSVLLASLAGMSLAGCCMSSICGCDPQSEAFDLDEPLTVEQVDAIVDQWGLQSPDEIACEEACAHVYREVRGWEVNDITDCTMILPESAGDTASPAADGSLQCAGEGIEYWCEGRRPLGHVEAAGEGGDALGRACASMAHLEAASVLAFEELAAQLRRLGAPEGLVARCLAAADDERSHARWLTSVATRLGASVPEPRSEAGPSTLLEIAVHNAVEGCVHETWAALAARVRSRAAPDAGLRRVFARIAEDEARHGQLAWDLHAWFLSRLDDAGRDRVLEAQRLALAALPEIARSQSGAPAALGQPPAEVAGALAADLAARLAA